ncbi:MAG: glycoside hydrolase family 88 protein [Arachidicoccus sp.]|nr:glycoside hydrolase family 88 protein [Arachidicoccus sp.]
MQKIITLLFIIACSVDLHAQRSMKKLIQEQFDFAAKQYKILASHTPPDKMPKTYYAKKDKWETSNTEWWCSGFYPGTLLYIYEYTKDTVILNEAKRRLVLLQPEDKLKGTHDLGFMMFCSFGNAYRILHDPLYKRVIDTAANTLALRYHPEVKAIQSWEKNKVFTYPVIIDNMMNLEMLCWNAQNNNEPNLQQIAETHANTTMKNHFRKDYSSYHVIDYNPETGEVIKKKTWQGANDSSAWARGQAWGLYGYTSMYRFTKEKKYLEQAKNIAHFIFTNPNLPSDMIPYWDYNAPGIPNVPRDVSAAAVTASALLELAQYVGKNQKNEYISAAIKIIHSLSSPAYRAKLGENGGYILLHSTGAFPMHSEVDVPLTYADYYFLEALHRYKEWYL